MVKNKRTYHYQKDHSHDMSYENEIKYDSVNAPAHYLHGRKETIDVISDCMTDDEYHGYLNIYKSHMMTSLRAIDFFNNIKKGKNCNEQGCKIDV